MFLSPCVLSIYLARYLKQFLGNWVSRILSYNPYDCVPFPRYLPNHNHSIAVHSPRLISG